MLGYCGLVKGCMLTLPPNMFGSFECVGQSMRLVYTWEELKEVLWLTINHLKTFTRGF